MSNYNNDIEITDEQYNARMLARITDMEGNDLVTTVAYSDADLDALLPQADQIAKSGTDCYIRWSRSSDGCSAYWSPNGASADRFVFTA